jgi:hypothetical protein
MILDDSWRNSAHPISAIDEMTRGPKHIFPSIFFMGALRARDAIFYETFMRARTTFTRRACAGPALSRGCNRPPN